MYEYKIIHKAGTKVGHADALSRLPLSDTVETDDEPETINSVELMSGISVDISQVQKYSIADDDFVKVYEFIMSKWPKSSQLNDVCSKFYKIRNSLSTENGCLFYGDRIIIPHKLQNYVLKTLHDSHTGIVRMKMIARSYVYWPNIDKDIQTYVNNCDVCQKTQSVNREHLTSKWPQCSYPFERIHLDFFYHAAKTFFIIVDSHSKYIDVQIMSKTNATSLINKFQSFFAIFGLPTEIVTDNGPPFSSYEFKTFCLTTASS